MQSARKSGPRSRALVRLGLPLILLLHATPVVAQLVGAAKIGVLRVQAKEGATADEAATLSAFLSPAVEYYSGMQAVSADKIKDMMVGSAAKKGDAGGGAAPPAASSGPTCTADVSSCIAQVCSALGVSEAVGAELGIFGDVWTLNIKRFKLKNLTAQKTVYVQEMGREISGGMISIYEQIPHALKELFADKPPPPPHPWQCDLWCQAGFGFFFGGVGLVAIGGIAQWKMTEHRDYYKRRGRDKEDYEVWRGISIGGYVVGSVAMAVGITAWIVDALMPSMSFPKADGKAPKAPKAPKLPVKIGAGFGPDGLNITIIGRW